ncbi:VWA domain-containing protein [Cupriavidus sp. 2TAF22]|uniref:vWA domain-containing protein n=1 Tax=unclassified Cupriavidus TaxID=2640874 RepID=UPI003F91543E
MKTPRTTLRSTRAPGAGRQRGQITLVAAVTMIGLLGAAGLAIDAGMAYVTKAKLNAAVDSAAVAAARAVTNGTTQPDQAAAARQAAQDFFNTNFPSGYLQAVPTLATPAVLFDTPTAGAVTINVSASATMPLTLMKVLGMNNVAVAATAQSIRKDLDLIFVIDASGSMSPVWSTVKSNANTFLDQFSPSSDRVGLVHFASGAVSDIPISKTTRGFDRKTMQSTISGLSNGGNTNYAEALYQARSQLDSITTNRSSLRVVVFFSDGQPNTLAATYQMGSTTSTRVTTCGRRSCSSTTTTGATTPTGNSCAGGITASSPGSTPNGFYITTVQNTKMSGACANVSNSNSTGDDNNGNSDGTVVTTTVQPMGMPQYYNAHNASDQEFPIYPTTVPYTVTSAYSSQNVYNAATNVAVEMASYLRNNNVYVFTLGLDGNGGFDANLLKNMANTIDAPLYNKNQTSGVYCYAKTIDNLKPCFSKLASEILRISK